MVDVCLLGCGGMLPLPGRYLASLLLRHGGRMAMVDCGEGTQVPFRLAGWGLRPLEAVFITHCHADHVAGLPGLLLTLGGGGRTEPLALYGPKGLREVVSGLRVIAPELPYDLRLYELPCQGVGEMHAAGLEVRAMPLAHGIPCLGYSFELKRPGRFDSSRAAGAGIPVGYWKRLQNGETVRLGAETFTPDMVMGPPRRGIKITYCTDTLPVAALESFAQGSDLFICEGMYGDDGMREKAARKGHMVFSQAAAIARRAGVDELWLTHYSPALGEPEMWLENARAIFPNTLAGRDLMKKTIRFRD